MIKMCDKNRGASVPMSHDIGTRSRYCTLTRMPSHITITLCKYAKFPYGMPIVPPYTTYVAFDDLVLQ